MLLFSFAVPAIAKAAVALLPLGQPTSGPANTTDTTATPTTRPGFVLESVPGWSVRRAGSFSIGSDAPAAYVDGLVKTAQATHDDVRRWCEQMKLRRIEPATPMVILFFNEWTAYRKFASDRGFSVSQEAPGFFDARTNVCLLFNFANADRIRTQRDALRRTAERLENRRRARELARAPEEAAETQLRASLEQSEARLAAHEATINATVVRHEIAHQVLHNLGLPAESSYSRRWLDEGLAMQFESPYTNPYRLADFLAVPESEVAPRLRELIRDATMLGPGAGRLPEAYAIVWAAVHTLARTQPDALAKLVQAAPRSGEMELTIFEGLFGPIDIGFTRKLRRFLEKPD